MNIFENSNDLIRAWDLYYASRETVDISKNPMFEKLIFEPPTLFKFMVWCRTQNAEIKWKDLTYGKLNSILKDLTYNDGAQYINGYLEHDYITNGMLGFYNGNVVRFYLTSKFGYNEQINVNHKIEVPQIIGVNESDVPLLNYIEVIDD